MLKPKADVKKFEEYDFKPCKGTARDNRTYLDIIYDLIKADMLESVFNINTECQEVKPLGEESKHKRMI